MNQSAINPPLTHQTIDSKLEKMGLRRDLIEKAIMEGLYSYLNVSKFHPKISGGSRAWQDITAGLRHELVAFDKAWKADYQRGLELTINPDKNLSLVVTSGDKDTGRRDGLPSTKNTKGSSTQNYINANYSLWDDEPTLDIISQINNPKIDPNETWVLLYTIDAKHKEIRFELSLPRGMRGHGENIRISDWQDRIVFDPISYNKPPQIDVDRKPEFNQSVEFDLTKKA